MLFCFTKTVAVRPQHHDSLPPKCMPWAVPFGMKQNGRQGDILVLTVTCSCCLIRAALVPHRPVTSAIYCYSTAATTKATPISGKTACMPLTCRPPALPAAALPLRPLRWGAGTHLDAIAISQGLQLGQTSTLNRRKPAPSICAGWYTLLLAAPAFAPLPPVAFALAVLFAAAAAACNCCGRHCQKASDCRWQVNVIGHMVPGYCLSAQVCIPAEASALQTPPVPPHCSNACINQVGAGPFAAAAGACCALHVTHKATCICKRITSRKRRRSLSAIAGAVCQLFDWEGSCCRKTVVALHTGTSAARHRQLC